MNTMTEGKNVPETATVEMEDSSTMELPMTMDVAEDGATEGLLLDEASDMFAQLSLSNQQKRFGTSEVEDLSAGPAHTAERPNWALAPDLPRHSLKMPPIRMQTGGRTNPSHAMESDDSSSKGEISVDHSDSKNITEPLGPIHTAERPNWALAPDLPEVSIPVTLKLRFLTKILSGNWGYMKNGESRAIAQRE